MLKGDIVKAYREGHTTYVTKHTKYGTFTGKVACAAEDYDVENDLDGYIFAEIQCDIQALKAQVRRMEQRKIGILHVYTVLKNSLSDDEKIKDKTLQKLYRQVVTAEKEVGLAKEHVKLLVTTYPHYAASRIQARRDFNTKH